MSRKQHIGRTINYILKDEAKLCKKGQKPIIVRKNLRSRTVKNMIKEFEKNESLRKCKRSDAVKLYHTVVSFHQKDSQFLSEKVLRDITREYMKQRGENIYLATVHYDKESHIHIHCVESGTRYMTGEANRLSKQGFQNLKINLQTFQKEKYPELSHSLPRHQKETKGRGKEQMIASRQTQKQSLLTYLKQAEQSSKSMNDILAILKEQGHEPYYRNGNLTGVKYEGDTKFRFSGLGYDKEKIAELNQRFEENRQLQELDDLRSSISASKEVEDNSKSKALEEENEEQSDNNMELETDDDDNG